MPLCPYQCSKNVSTFFSAPFVVQCKMWLFIYLQPGLQWVKRTIIWKDLDDWAGTLITFHSWQQKPFGSSHCMLRIFFLLLLHCPENAGLWFLKLNLRLESKPKALSRRPKCWTTKPNQTRNMTSQTLMDHIAPHVRKLVKCYPIMATLKQSLPAWSSSSYPRSATPPSIISCWFAGDFIYILERQ